MFGRKTSCSSRTRTRAFKETEYLPGSTCACVRIPEVFPSLIRISLFIGIRSNPSIPVSLYNEEVFLGNLFNGALELFGKFFSQQSTCGNWWKNTWNIRRNSIIISSPSTKRYMVSGTKGSDES